MQTLPLPLWGQRGCFRKDGIPYMLVLEILHLLSTQVIRNLASTSTIFFKYEDSFREHKLNSSFQFMNIERKGNLMQ